MINSKTKKRDYQIDLLRIVACFMVITLHVAAQNFYKVSPKLVEWQVYNFFDSLTRAGVPIFLMISGVFFLNPTKKLSLSELYHKYIKRLVIAYAIYSVVYGIYNYIINNNTFTILKLAKCIIEGMPHLWYIPTMIVLYILSPLFKKITYKADKKLFKYIFGVFLVAVSLNTITYMKFLPKFSWIKLIIDKIPLGLICQYYSYFIIGWFLYNIPLDIKKWKLILTFAICFVFTFTVTSIWSISVDKGTTALYSNFSIMTCLEGISIFLLFRYSDKIKKVSEKYERKIALVASSTFGIYLIHFLFIGLIYDFKVLAFVPTIIFVPLVSLIVFLLSFLCVQLVKKIPIISNYIT